MNTVMRKKSSTLNTQYAYNYWIDESIVSTNRMKSTKKELWIGKIFCDWKKEISKILRWSNFGRFLSDRFLSCEQQRLMSIWQVFYSISRMNTETMLPGQSLKPHRKTDTLLSEDAPRYTHNQRYARFGKVLGFANTGEHLQHPLLSSNFSNYHLICRKPNENQIAKQ